MTIDLTNLTPTETIKTMNHKVTSGMNESLETYALRLGIALFLIKQELSIRHFVTNLHASGITHITLNRNLDNHIREILGLDDGTEETLNRYNAIMNKHATELNVPTDPYLTPAHKACLELTALSKPKAT
jgi:hypothetical protein